ncbi:MAG: rhomboid family intramembrane serine protease [Solobacterium sp.]|nr:rhomboid family intramembrane serine protease [Erysipelotrichaceae bacterium]MBQ6593115.1 rhomboid family intramembrane serine protease [Solobacterium sp.]MBR0477724.1 rhomboid family intramembrane serine protease [Solobacterium sp.]
MKKKVYINAPITLGFALIGLVVLILGLVTNGSSTMKFFCTYPSSWKNPLTWLRLVTHVFGHSGISHYAGNMVYILLLGPILEEKYHENLIWVILITAVVTGLIHNILFQGALLGSSGVCFAFILLASVTGRQKGIPLTLILVAVFWIGNEIYTGLTAHDQISQITHIIGGVCGGMTGLFFKDN